MFVKPGWCRLHHCRSGVCRGVCYCIWGQPDNTFYEGDNVTGRNVYRANLREPLLTWQALLLTLHHNFYFGWSISQYLHYHFTVLQLPLALVKQLVVEIKSEWISSNIRQEITQSLDIKVNQLSHTLCQKRKGCCQSHKNSDCIRRG